MFPETLSFLKCPVCQAELSCGAAARGDIVSGTVSCTGCARQFPVLAGVLILVPDVRSYLVEHVKGISRQVSDQEIPKEHRAAFIKAKRQIPVEHIEEDLESERVTSLYAMNSYLRAAEVGSPSRTVDALIKQHWDNGPFARIRARISKIAGGDKRSLVELGCGLGGLYSAVHGQLKAYLGLDSSFASIVLARHFTLGAPMNGKLRVPHDLLWGPVSREVNILAGQRPTSTADFIVCELDHPPVKAGLWDMTAALNVIDMLPEPAALPELQFGLLSPGGVAIQSSPYIWHESVAAGLREMLPPNTKDSAAAAEWLYRESGFEITSVDSDVPWVFFKNIRQVELYSVHLFFAAKPLR